MEKYVAVNELICRPISVTINCSFSQILLIRAFLHSTSFNTSYTIIPIYRFLSLANAVEPQSITPTLPFLHYFAHILVHTDVTHKHVHIFKK